VERPLSPRVYLVYIYDSLLWIILSAVSAGGEKTSVEDHSTLSVYVRGWIDTRREWIICFWFNQSERTKDVIRMWLMM